MRLGIRVNIDVTKLDKDRFIKGELGTYVDLVTFIDTFEKGKYGDNGVIRQSINQEEREQGVKMPIIGNCKVFYTAESNTNNNAITKDSTGSNTNQDKNDANSSEETQEHSEVPF